jgi:hypothetical protein
MVPELYRFEETARQGEETLPAAHCADNQTGYERDRNHEE